MSSDVPYIGSKISLVSKAKVRYEGYLYTIDAEKLTVTLAKVKTFGTEDRAEEVVPPKNEIYEYVVFRGKDIDDLVVCETPQQYKQDPAIVQTGSASHDGLGLGPTYDTPQQPMPNPYSRPQPYYGYGAYGGGNMSNVNPYPMNFHPQAPIVPVPKPGDISNASSGSNTQKQHQMAESGGAGPSEEKPQASYAAPGGPVKAATKPHHQPKPAASHSREPHKAKTKEDSRESSANDANYSKHANSEDSKAEGSSKKEQKSDSGHRQPRAEHKDGERKPRPRRSNDSHPQGAQKSLYTKTKSGFSEEFDFQSSNAKFNKEEIEEEILKTLRKSLKVTNDSAESSATEESQSTSSRNTSSILASDELPSPDRCYNKATSFFDNISCESANRADNKFRSEERKLNTETFGAEGHSYRGRPRGRGRGRGRGGRGGWTGHRSSSDRESWSYQDRKKVVTTTND